MAMHRFAVTLTLAAAAAYCTTALGQTYPTRAIRVIIPAAPADSCDVLSRLVGAKVSERLGQQLVIDNRPGAGGQIGLQLLTQVAPDGYTIACGQGGNMVIVPLSYQKVAYDTMKDFAPIALMASNFLGLVVHPSVPFKTTKELIAYAKANPGKLTFGSTGEGAFLHFATELFSRQAGFKYLHVPLKSASAIHTEVMAGRLDASFGSFISLQPHVVSGRLRLLGVARATRAPSYPDFPTIAESLPGFESGGWFGMIGPATMPKSAVSLLNQEFNRALMLPDVRDKLAAFGLEVHTESPEYFSEVIRRDFEKWGKLARDIGFRPR
jgi:tripartite-type tricarboxylate transporter receptor subunit TctC